MTLTCLISFRIYDTLIYHNHRHVSGKGRIHDILNVPKVVGINPPYEHEHMAYQQVASDCIWSDPASAEQENNTVDVMTGFGDSLRGGGAICFGNKAVTDFLVSTDHYSLSISYN